MDLHEIFSKLLDQKEKWSYYKHFDYENFDIERIKYYPYQFVEKYLRVGDKSPDDLVNQFPLRDDRKMFHSVSIFFLGIYLYTESNTIKKYVNEYLDKIKSVVKDKGEDIDIVFPYYWFLTCFYHDLCFEVSIRDEYDGDFYGYNLWNIEIEKKVKKTLDSLQPLGIDIPQHIKNCVKKYLDYRKDKGNPIEHIEHGILGGTYFYHERREKFNKKRDFMGGRDSFIDPDTGLHWSTNLLEQVHSSISWTIISHNIWYPEPDDRKNYIDNHLNELLDKPKVSINRYPLYFFLCLIDTLDPVKYFSDEIRRERKISKDEYLKNCDLTMVNDSQFIIQLKGDIIIYFENYYYKLKGSEYWLGIVVDKIIEPNSLLVTITKD